MYRLRGKCFDQPSSTLYRLVTVSAEVRRSAAGGTKLRYRPDLPGDHVRQRDFGGHIVSPPVRSATTPIADDDLWLSPSKLAVVEALLEALGEGASVVLAREPGVARRAPPRALRHRIPAAGFGITYYHNATFGQR